MLTLPVYLKVSRAERRVEVFRQVNVEQQSQTNRHICVSGQIKVIGNRVGDRVEPGFQQGDIRIDMRIKIGRRIVQRVCEQHLLRTADREHEDTQRDIVVIDLHIPGIFKLRRDLLVMDDRADDQLWEEGDKKQIVQHMVLPRLSAVGIHKERDQLESEERDADRKRDIFQHKVGSGQRIQIFDKEVIVFIVSEQGYVSENSGGQQQPALQAVFISLQTAERRADNVVCEYASHKKGKEIRTSL